MAVERCLQPLLVKVVTNETNAATKNKQTVKSTDLDVLVSLLGGKCTTITEQVNETDSNTAIDVENKLKRIPINDRDRN